MSAWLRVVTLVAATCLLTACSASGPLAPKPLLQIDGLSFLNQSRQPVTAIRLLVPATNNFVSCGFISPGGHCASSFPEVDYTGNPFVVEWTQGGADWSTGEITLQPGETLIQAGVARVQVVVMAPGSAGARFVASSAVR